jgi:rhodanese-related sulfurtransferase
MVMMNDSHAHGSSAHTLGRTLRQMAAIIILAAATGLLVNHFRSDRLPLIGDWSMKAQLTLSSGDTLLISLDEAQALFLAGEAVFIDARPDEHYRSGHIQGARNLPWEEFAARFEEVTADMASDAVIITYCDEESCSLSKDLAFALLGKGFINVRVLVNGWTLWQQANLPRESDLNN